MGGSEFPSQYRLVEAIPWNENPRIPVNLNYPRTAAQRALASIDCRRSDESMTVWKM